MNSLRRRVENLEDTSHIFEPTPPPGTPEARAARESFQDAMGALRERTGGARVDHDPDDPVVDDLAKAARSAFRYYIRATRSRAETK